jgi:hypothetical protein
MKILVTILILLPFISYCQINPHRQAYAFEGYENKAVKFHLDIPDSFITITSMPASIAAASFNGKWYAVRWTGINQPEILVTVDTITGAINAITPIYLPYQHLTTGIVYDHTTNTVYIIASPYGFGVRKLAALDISSGEIRIIGEITSNFITQLTCSREGILYSFDKTINQVIIIDKLTGTPSPLGNLGVNLREARGLNFDHSTGELFLAGEKNQNTYYYSDLYKINLNNGAASLAGRLARRYISGLTIITDAGELKPFSKNYPADNIAINTVRNSNESFLFDWDTSRANATYKLYFGSPTLNEVKFKINAYGDQLITTLGILDSVLASIGLNEGDSIMGEWDIYAYRNNAAYDSLKSSNGPRNITLRRAVPALSAFNLNEPTNNSTVTSVFSINDRVKFNWRASGIGIRYKWRFLRNDTGNELYNFNSSNEGLDTFITFRISDLDSMLAAEGLNRGDSIIGNWEVWAYNQYDSARSSDKFNVSLKRKNYADILVSYDTIVYQGGKIAIDSVKNNLDQMNIDYDILVNSVKKYDSFSFKGYRTVIWLGNAITVKQKDSLKSFLDYNLVQKPNLILYSSGTIRLLSTESQYNLNWDTVFAHQYLGSVCISNGGYFQIMSDRIIGENTNAGIADSFAFSYSNPIKPSWIEGAERLYKYASHPGGDTSFAVGVKNSKFNIVVFGALLERTLPSISSPEGSAIRRALEGALSYVDFFIPVELISLTSFVSKNNVILSWSTATETNNRGFEVQRMDVEVMNKDWEVIAFIQGQGTTTEKKTYSYEDKNLTPGKYNYRLKQIDYDGTYKYYTLSETVEINLPFVFALHQNYPNPFNPVTKIKFVIPTSPPSPLLSKERGGALVTLKIYDILGNEVTTLINESKAPGEYEVEWNAANFSSGVYFYTLRAGGFVQTRKLVLLR